MHFLSIIIHTAVEQYNGQGLRDQNKNHYAVWIELWLEGSQNQNPQEICIKLKKLGLEVDS